MGLPTGYANMVRALAESKRSYPYTQTHTTHVIFMPLGVSTPNVQPAAKRNMHATASYPLTLAILKSTACTVIPAPKPAAR